MKGERFAGRCNVAHKPWYVASDPQNIAPRRCLQLRNGQEVLGQRRRSAWKFAHFGMATSAGVVMLQ
jgi:hypothetical protein